MLRTLSLSFLAASFYSPSPDSAVYKFTEFDGGPVSALGPSAFPVVSQRLMVVFFTHCCCCQCHGNLEIPHSVAYSHSCFLNHTYAHNFVLNFWSSLTPLLLGFCCLLFLVPRATFSCCIRKHSLPFDDAVENLRGFVRLHKREFIKTGGRETVCCR